MNTTEQQFSQLVRDNRSTIYAVWAVSSVASAA